MNSLNKYTKNPAYNSKDGQRKFEDAFDIILKDISLILNEKPQSALEGWIKLVAEYNVPHGKKIRGKLVESAYIVLSGETEGKNVENAQILGWCVEILQGAFLIVDDLMDNGTTRRGQPCWFKVNNMGTIVTNDALILENLVYQIVKLHFGNSKFYADLLEIILGVTFNTTLGQSLDTRYASINDNKEHFDQPIMQTYQSIAILKTSYYTTYLPIALAMVLSGFGRADDYEKKELWKEFKAIALKIGTFFQIQDDYFDCYGDEEKTGKVGSDIQEGKCSWLYAKAKKLSDPRQTKILDDNYGISNIANILRVKELYLELGLPNEFLKLQQEMSTEILKSIDQLKHPKLKLVLQHTYTQIIQRLF